MDFEGLLARRVALLLASGGLVGIALVACNGDGSDSEGPSVAELCAGDLPAGWVIDRGYVKVDLGGDCPEVADAQLSHTSCCPDMIHEGATCSFESKAENQVDNSTGYGPIFEPAGTGEVGFDLCWYEGVFSEGNSCCGRPLLGEAGPVVAAPVSGDPSWIAAQTPSTSGLGAGLRSMAGLHWLESALLEHASVASFARFALELMQLGAPPALVREAHLAAMQEVTHAELCFGLASAYLGRPVGPGPLEIDRAHAPAASIGAFLEAVIREGCVGETLAAVEAAARLARATDPAVRAVLQAIVDDESAHAALAWKTLRWALDRDSALRDRVARVFADEAARWTAPIDASAPLPPEGRAHGLLSASERAAILADGWSSVIAPAVAALL